MTSGDVAAGLVDEGWWCPGREVGAFCDTAAQENRFIVGGIGWRHHRPARRRWTPRRWPRG